MSELREVKKSGTVDLTLDDLIQMRVRVTNQRAYVDLLLEWARLAEAEIKRLRAKERGRNDD